MMQRSKTKMLHGFGNQLNLFTFADLLISNVSESDVFNIHMTDPNLHFIDVKNHRFGSNETVGVLCFTSSFFVDPKSLKLKAITTDGGRFDIGEYGIL